MLTNRWLILAVLALARISMGFQFQSVASTSALLTEDLGVGYTEIGSLIGLYMLPGVFLAFPVGVIGARFGDKRIVGYGLLAMAVGGLAMGFSSSFPQLMAGRLLSGIGSIALNVVVAKMVADWFADREIRLAMGIILGTWPMGIALGLVAHGPMAAAYSWQATMFATAVVSAFGMALVVGLYSSPTYMATEKRPSLHFALPGSQFVLVCLSGIAWAVFNVGYAIFFSFGPDVLQSRGVDSIDASALVSIGVWISIVSVPIGGYLTERFGRTNAFIAVFSLLCAAAMGLFPFLSFSIGLSILLGLFIGPPPGAMVALPSEALTPENRGAGLGVFYTWFYLGMAVGPVIAGLGRDVTGTAATPLLIGAAMFVLVIPFLVAFRMSQSRNAG